MVTRRIVSGGRSARRGVGAVRTGEAVYGRHVKAWRAIADRALAIGCAAGARP